MNPSQYRHIFFDLDGTITRSRSRITLEMKQALTDLQASGRDVVIVSGAAVKQIQYQADNFPCFYLGQNGNHAVDGTTGEELWRELLSDSEKEAIYTHIRSIPRDWPVKDENDLIEDRGSQVSYSLLGHHEEVSKKEAFDPGGTLRAKLLLEHPLISETVEVKIGGTTCFDYIQKGKHKGYNVLRLINKKGWKKEECIYEGDALYEGGNDETVINVIDTQLVENPEVTRSSIMGILGH